MNTFLKTYRLALTPLSPIHIGCGEDFEPTNYVMEDGVLYGFDPSRAALTEAQGRELMQIANNGDWLGIQRFFKKHAKIFQAQANLLIPVARGVQDQYDRTFGNVANVENNGNVVINRLALERAVSVGPSQQPYIPGSSFKGALRTAMTDALNAGRPPQEDTNRSTTALERRVLRGDFESSPLRLLKVSDLIPASAAATRIQYSVNQKKRLVFDRTGLPVQARGPSARKECILPGQFRLFAGSITLPDLAPHLGSTNSKGKLQAPIHAIDLHQIAKETNQYHRDRLSGELNELSSRKFIDPDWQGAIERLLQTGSLAQMLNIGKAMLVRIGRYGGAESKTLSKVASIKIMRARGQSPTFESTTKTVWLAAEYEHEQKHLLPFGWAVVEIDPQGDLPELENWCAEQSKGRPDMAAKRRAFEAEQLAAQQRKAELERQAQAQAQAQLAQQRAAQQRAAALAAMSEQAKKIETLRQQCEDWAAKLPPNGNFKKQTPDVGKAGFYQEATKLVKTALESTDWSVADKSAMADMLEQWLPQVIAPWDPKEQRKKLKFAALRGQNS